MSLFELVFGLGAIILGLGLTHLATSLQRLISAGRRVRWAPEPLLLASLIFLVIVSVWLGQWFNRGETRTTMGLVLLQVLKLLLPYMAAAFVLPEAGPEQETIDLFQHYDRTRVYTFGSLILGLLLFWVYRLIEQSMAVQGPRLTLSLALREAPWLYGSLYAVLIVVRWRWLNMLVLAAALLAYGSAIIPRPLVQ